MKVVPTSLVPLAHVRDVDESIRFYTLLGFEVRNTVVPEGGGVPTWAYLRANQAQLMLARATDPVDPERQGVLFYLYFDHLSAVHSHLAASGLKVGPLSYPFYCPGGEFRLLDPDGYCLMLSHT